MIKVMDLSQVKVKEDVSWAQVLGVVQGVADQIIEYDPATGLYIVHEHIKDLLLMYNLLVQFTDADLSAITDEKGEVDIFQLHRGYGAPVSDDLYALYDEAHDALCDVICERKRQYDAALSVGAQLKRIADRLSKLDGKDVGVLRRLLTEAVIKTQKGQKPEAAGNTPIVDMGAFKAKKKDKQD